MTGKLIYAADDEADILDVMREFLQNAGFEVRTFSTGDALYEEFQKHPCDLVVLDIMMPGTDGLTICKMLREISAVPIVILTAKESETDHMRGFLLGGDDYLIKPFSPSLLVVRIKALLRRMEMLKPAAQHREFGDLEYSESEHTVKCGGEILVLTVTEFSLLGCLVENAGQPVSRDDLLNRVWGIDSDDIETRVTDETVRRVRQKLKSAGSCVKITAVWGYGYKLEVQNA
ncbi:MAG: response regulator transcription factor [Oscillospiraceae bacterium]|nr:response regulator transcription factor [Oscillospiraceae bacterium]